MKINKLYNFIRDELGKALQTSKYLQVTNFTLKVSSAGVPCAFYELAKAQKNFTLSTNNSYKLQSHHLSFYAMQKDNDPTLNQYHYTGYFIDEAGSCYQLHVYFDNNDQSVSACLSLDDTKQNLNRDDLDKVIRFALANSSKVMADLRKQHDDLVASLECDYHEMETTLCDLSEDLLVQQDAYQEKVTAILTILKPLINYHYDERFKHILILFENIATLNLNNADANNEIPAVLPEVEHDELDNHSASTVIVVKPKLQPIIQEAFKVRKKLSTVTLSNGKIPLLLNLYQKINELLLLAEDENYQVTSLDLQQINALYIANNLQIEKFLLTALMNKNTDAISSFQGVIKFFPHNWLPLALKTNNAIMLDFILVNGNFCLNTTTVSGDISAVQYCYKNGEKYSDCLAILIKHKATLLSPAEDGLPIAHHILADQFHPLRTSLWENFNSTLGNRKFYRSLICQLEICLVELDLNDSVKTNILLAISQYKTDLLSIVSNGDHKTFFRQSREVQELALKHKAIRPQVSEISTDPDCQKKIKLYHREVAKYRKSLSLATSYQLNSASLDVRQNIIQMLKDIEFKATDKEIGSRKNELLEGINEQIVLLRYLQEINEIVNKVKNPGNLYNKRKVAEFNNLRNRGKTLLTEVQTIAGKYSFLKTTSPENVNKILLVETLGNMTEGLSDLMSALKAISDGFTPLRDSLKTHGFFESSTVDNEGKQEANHCEPTSPNVVARTGSPSARE